MLHASNKSKYSSSKIFEKVRDEQIVAGGEQEWSDFMIQGGFELNF